MTKSLTKKNTSRKKPAKVKVVAKKTPRKRRVSAKSPTPTVAVEPGRIVELVDMNRLPFEKQAALVLNTFPGENLGIVIKTKTDSGLHDARLPKLQVKPANR